MTEFKEGVEDNPKSEAFTACALDSLVERFEQWFTARNKDHGDKGYIIRVFGRGAMLENVPLSLAHCKTIEQCNEEVDAIKRNIALGKYIFCADVPSEIPVQYPEEAEDMEDLEEDIEDIPFHFIDSVICTVIEEGGEILTAEYRAGSMEEFHDLDIPYHHANEDVYEIRLCVLSVTQNGGIDMFTVVEDAYHKIVDWLSKQSWRNNPDSPQDDPDNGGSSEQL